MQETGVPNETYEKYQRAGTVLQDVLETGAELIEPGVSRLEVAETLEAQIYEDADGCAFPVNISVNEEASHATPAADSSETFDDEMVCLDCGVHVDGYIADAATTVDLSGNSALVDAAEEALDAALELVGPGVPTGRLGEAVEEVIRGYGFTPVLNLSGHGVSQWDAHTAPNIPNRGTDRSVELSVGDVIAIEPFATTGRGKVSEGADTEIYSLENDRSVRDRSARAVLEQVKSEYKTLPFAGRWIEASRSEIALRRLEQKGILHSYPVLKEQSGELVSQAEDTLIITEDGYENLTR
ncbi:MAG: methionine aminopeptidase, type II [Haloquadratum sp. J07HQX50]|jgi:methionine aminopeptidase, type II (EC 3.4.11.18)|nr:MAG: methionine aminopeptidase, type II [Haloquadratum sp. J07HQX50]